MRAFNSTGENWDGRAAIIRCRYNFGYTEEWWIFRRAAGGPNDDFLSCGSWDYRICHSIGDILALQALRSSSCLLRNEARDRIRRSRSRWFFTLVWQNTTKYQVSTPSTMRSCVCMIHFTVERSSSDSFIAGQFIPPGTKVAIYLWSMNYSKKFLGDQAAELNQMLARPWKSQF